MIQFTYSFCMALMHSFWQAALLLLLYLTVDKVIHKNNAPLAKRNFLYAAVAVQLVLFVFTFFIYFFDAQGMGNLPAMVQNMTAYIAFDDLRSITPWIFSTYTCIIAYKLVKAIFSWYQFKQQFKTGLQKPPVHLKVFSSFEANRFGIKRKVNLWLSNSIHTPVTFGFFKPVILLPVALVNNISTRQAESLILHELTHIRSNDYLLNWFLMIAETIFFFNPFVIDLCKKIRLEREKNCDMQVMSFAYSPALYAETLLTAERIKRVVPAFQLAAVNRKKQLLQRIQFFTNEKILNQPLRFNIVAPLIGLILLFMLSAAVLFQTGKTTVWPLQSATGISSIPFSNFIIPDAEYGKHIITTNKAKESTVEQRKPQQPAIKNPINLQTETAGIPERKKDVEISKVADVNFAVPISTLENDAARQIIIKEEGSGSASVKVYYLGFENGKWILQPEWVLTAREIRRDSLSGKIDSLGKNLRRIFPPQQ